VTSFRLCLIWRIVLNKSYFHFPSSGQLQQPQTLANIPLSRSPPTFRADESGPNLVVSSRFGVLPKGSEAKSFFPIIQCKCRGPPWDVNPNAVNGLCLNSMPSKGRRPLNKDPLYGEAPSCGFFSTTVLGWALLGCQICAEISTRGSRPLYTSNFLSLATPFSYEPRFRFRRRIIRVTFRSAPSPLLKLRRA